MEKHLSWLNQVPNNESNNLDEVSVLGIGEDSYLEYHSPKEFYDCILSLKSKDARDERISEGILRNVKCKIKQ